MRSHPIWIDVEACIYKSKKSYGARDCNTQNIYVGTSKTNSHHLAEVVTTRKVIGENTIFRLYVDKKIIKEIIMNTKTKEVI